jgi:hypothetical protein
MLIESPPKIFYFTDHSIVEPLLRRRWRELASKSSVKAFDTTA